MTLVSLHTIYIAEDIAKAERGEISKNCGGKLVDSQLSYNYWPPVLPTALGRLKTAKQPIVW